MGEQNDVTTSGEINYQDPHPSTPNTSLDITWLGPHPLLWDRLQ